MKTKTLAIIFIVLIGVLLIAAAALLVFLLTRSKPEPKSEPDQELEEVILEPEPEEIILVMADNMEKIETVKYNTEYSVNEKDINVLSIKTEADIDLFDYDNINSESLIYYKSFPSEESEYEIISIGNISYVKVNYPYHSAGGGEWIRTNKYEDDIYFPIKRIMSIFKNEYFYSFSQKLPNEQINGLDVYHYTVSPGDLEIDNFDAWSLYSKPKDLIHIYIGKEDNLLYRLSYSIEDDNHTYSYNIEFSDYNQVLNIRAPIEYKTELEISASTSIKSYLSSLRPAGELYAIDNGDSYMGFCAVMDAVRIFAKIAENGSKAICSDTNKTWVACAQLSRNPAFYFCTDSTGAAKEMPGTCSIPWKYTACP